MDGLWDPPNYEATEDIYPLIPFSVAYDVKKEAAINEKCCIQVLRILISKADTDIIELEEELLDLLSQLAFTDEEFLNLFYMSLETKLDHLIFSTRNLEKGAGNVLATTKEPVESIYAEEPVDSIFDMLKSLFILFSQKKDQQVCAVNPSWKKKQTGSHSNANQMEISKRVIITPSEKDSISLAIVKVEEEDASYLCPTPLSKYSHQNHLQGSMENMNKEENRVQIKSPKMTKDMIKNKILGCKNICQNPSFETQATMKHPLKMVKSQIETDEESIGSTSLCLVESSQEPNANQNFIKELGFYLGNSNAEDHEKLIVPFSPSRYSTKTYKRRHRLGSPLARESSPCQEPIPLCILGLDVANKHDMDDYTVDELKDIARQRKLKGYCKLRKAELARLVGIKVTDGKRKVKKKETCSVLRIKGAP